ncbi:hypothetical protein ARSEF4850_004911 [Beauveria asiatica]
MSRLATADAEIIQRKLTAARDPTPLGPNFAASQPLLYSGKYENDNQFWRELDGVVSSQCSSDYLIDNALREWLRLTVMFRDAFPGSEDDMTKCTQKLLGSDLFCGNKDYVRTQIIHSLLQEDNAGPLYVLVDFLLVDGRTEEVLFLRMIEASCFRRLVDLMRGSKKDDPRLHSRLSQLMYEMVLGVRLPTEDLLYVDDGFVSYLFQILEEAPDEVMDPHHHSIFRFLLVLNEQYMIHVVDPSYTALAILPNRVVKHLAIGGLSFRTFGSKLILLLDRETGMAQQLLILKLLYLVFTTKATSHYFATKDLRLLLDIFIRNLSHLSDKMPLIHTYLRVLYPLLAHSQLNRPPYYKRDEILKAIKLPARLRNERNMTHNATTSRLIERVSKVEWLAEEEARDFKPEQAKHRRQAAPSTPSQQCELSTTGIDDREGLTALGIADSGRTQVCGGDSVRSAQITGPLGHEVDRFLKDAANELVTAKFENSRRRWLSIFLSSKEETFLPTLSIFQRDSHILLKEWQITRLQDENIEANVKWQQSNQIDLFDNLEDLMSLYNFMMIQLEDSSLPHYLWDVERSETRPVEDIYKSTGKRPNYVAISHTWGRWKMKGQLEHLSGVPWAIPKNTRFDVGKLPQILKENFPRKYIWIDLLTIPQGSEEKERKDEEIRKQTSIFHNANVAVAWLNDVEHWDGLASTVRFLCFYLLKGSASGESHIEALPRAYAAQFLVHIIVDSAGILSTT